MTGDILLAWQAGFFDGEGCVAIQVKEKRIRLAIEFHKKMKVWNAEYGRRGYPEVILAERERYFLEMKALNQRGVSASNPEPKQSGPGKGARNVLSEKRHLISKSTPEKGEQKEKVSVQ